MKLSIMSMVTLDWLCMYSFVALSSMRCMGVPLHPGLGVELRDHIKFLESLLTPFLIKFFTFRTIHSEDLLLRGV